MKGLEFVGMKLLKEMAGTWSQAQNSLMDDNQLSPFDLIRQTKIVGAYGIYALPLGTVNEV